MNLLMMQMKNKRLRKLIV